MDEHPWAPSPPSHEQDTNSLQVTPLPQAEAIAHLHSQPSRKEHVQ